MRFRRSTALILALLLLASGSYALKAQEVATTVRWHLEETGRILGQEPDLSLTSVQDLVQRGDTLFTGGRCPPPGTESLGCGP